MHAVIIAGGKGKRLGGVRKAEIRIGGIRLIDRVRRALGDVGEPLTVATGPGDSWLHDPTVRAVPDLDSQTGGPLAGLAAAVSDLRIRGIQSGLLVSVSVDTPFLPDTFVAVLREAIGEAPAAYAAWGEDFYPPNAIWRIEALRTLPDQIREGTAEPSLKALLHSVAARQVDWRGRSRINPFLNINSLDDLVTLGRMVRDSGPPPLIHKADN